MAPQKSFPGFFRIDAPLSTDLAEMSCAETHMPDFVVKDSCKNSHPAFVPGHAFYPDPAGESELRLCFSSVLPNTIDDAVRRLAGCIARALPVRSVAI